MAGYMKKIMIIGNVGRDPETRYTQDGTQVTSFSVAVSERPRRGQGGDPAGGGQPEETTTWFRVSAWRRQAEIVSQYVTKGMSVFVMGNLTTREYQGNDGKTHTSLDITADDIQFLTPKGAQEAGAGGFDESSSFNSPQPTRPSASYGNRPAGGQQGGQRQAAAEPAFEEDESDIPF